MFRGVYAALLTPFDDRGDLIEGRLRDHVEWLIGKGIDGLYVCGNSGQGLYQSVNERKRVAEIVKEQAGDRCELIGHVAALATRDACELAAHAAAIGLDAVASLSPIYWPHSDEEIVDYYDQLMEACSLPGLMYIFSGPAMPPLSVDTVLKVAAIDGMVGMKYTNPDFFLMQEICQRLNDRWVVLSGPDQLFLPALTMGVNGSIGTTQNVFPELFIEIQQCFENGDLDRAMAVQRVVTRIVRLYRPYGGCVTAHAMLAARGFPISCCRAPFRKRLPENVEVALTDSLRQALADSPVPIELT